jgi:hypothetical protein
MTFAPRNVSGMDLESNKPSRHALYNIDTLMINLRAPKHRRINIIGCLHKTIINIRVITPNTVLLAIIQRYAPILRMEIPHTIRTTASTNTGSSHTKARGEALL